jgi:hypothetical protein
MKASMISFMIVITVISIILEEIFKFKVYKDKFKIYKHLLGG